MVILHRFLGMFTPSAFATLAVDRRRGQVTPRRGQVPRLRRLRRRSESLRDWRDFRARLVQGVEQPGDG